MSRVQNKVLRRKADVPKMRKQRNKLHVFRVFRAHMDTASTKNGEKQSESSTHPVIDIRWTPK